MQIRNPEELDQQTLLRIAHACEDAAQDDHPLGTRDVDLMITAVMLTVARSLKVAADYAGGTVGNSHDWKELLKAARSWRATQISSKAPKGAKAKAEVKQLLRAIGELDDEPPPF